MVISVDYFELNGSSIWEISQLSGDVCPEQQALVPRQRIQVIHNKLSANHEGLLGTETRTVREGIVQPLPLRRKALTGGIVRILQDVTDPCGEVARDFVSFSGFQIKQHDFFGGFSVKIAKDVFGEKDKAGGGIPVHVPPLRRSVTSLQVVERKPFRTTKNVQCTVKRVNAVLCLNELLMRPLESQALQKAAILLRVEVSGVETSIPVPM